MNVEQHETLTNQRTYDTQREYWSALTGKSLKEVGELTAEQQAEIKTELNKVMTEVIPPVYLFKFREKVFGYYPIEQGDLDDAILLEGVQKTGNKHSMLAALFFREVTRYPKVGKWETIAGLECRVIRSDDFREYSHYKTKKLADWNKVDFAYFDKLPIQIIASAVGFTTGVGLSASTSTPINSQSKMINGIMTMALSMQMIIHTGMRLRYHSQQLLKEKPAYCDTRGENQYSRYLDLLHLNLLSGEGLQERKQKLLGLLGAPLVEASKAIDKITQKIYSEEDLAIEEISTLFVLANVVHRNGRMSLQKYMNSKIRKNG